MSIWHKLYLAYEKKDCEQIKKLFGQLTEKDKESPYFSKYWSLYIKECGEKKEKGKILLKGKAIKCPHCGASIGKSEYNNESIRKYIQNGKKGEINFICNYCGTEFVWKVTSFKSLFTGYKIGQEVEIDGNKYKISGGVKYRGTYSESDGGGSLEYIEWLSYDKKGELFYISESLAKDSYGEYKDVEVSKKVNFPFVIKDYSSSFIWTDKGKYSVKEYDEVEVVELVGELNKSYQIGEKVKLYVFKDYTLEEEKGENNIERNLYKNVSNGINDLGVDIENSFKQKILENIGFLFFVGYVLFIFYPLIAFVFILLIILYYIFFKKSKNPFLGLFKYMALTLLFIFVSIFLGFLLFTEKQEYQKPLREISSIKEGKYMYKFANPINFSGEIVNNYTYGTEYANGYIDGFRFSIQDNKDRELFENLKNNPNIIKTFNKYGLKVIKSFNKLDVSENDLIIKYK